MPLIRRQRVCAWQVSLSWHCRTFVGCLEMPSCQLHACTEFAPSLTNCTVLQEMMITKWIKIAQTPAPALFDVKCGYCSSDIVPMALLQRTRWGFVLCENQVKMFGPFDVTRRFSSFPKLLSWPGISPWPWLDPLPSLLLLLRTRAADPCTGFS